MSRNLEKDTEMEHKNIGGYTDVLNILRSTFNYEKLHDVTKTVVENLNKVIDINFYPTPKTKTSNMRHRPIGLGVQGLADTFMILEYAFESDEAVELNKKIFETIYYLTTSLGYHSNIASSL